MVAIPAETAAGEPAVAQAAAASQFRRGEAAQPDFDGLLDGLGLHPHSGEREARPLVVDGVLAGVPEATHQGQGLVEPGCPVATGDPERLVLGGVGDSEAEGGEGPPAGDEVEAGDGLGAEHRIAAGKHHDRRPELEAFGAACRIGHGDHRVEGEAVGPLAHPEGVEAEGLEVVDEATEQAGVAGVRRSAETEADADLHDSAAGAGAGRQVGSTQPSAAVPA